MITTDIKFKAMVAQQVISQTLEGLVDKVLTTPEEFQTMLINGAKGLSYEFNQMNIRQLRLDVVHRGRKASTALHPHELFVIMQNRDIESVTARAHDFARRQAHDFLSFFLSSRAKDITVQYNPFDKR